MAKTKTTGNYLGGSLIKMEAILNGFKEGIALTVDGYLSEGSGENLLLARGRVLLELVRNLQINVILA